MSLEGGFLYDISWSSYASRLLYPRPFAVAFLYYVVFRPFTTCASTFACTGVCLAYCVASPLFRPLATAAVPVTVVFLLVDRSNVNAVDLQHL